MPYIVAVLVLVGTVTLANLVLTLGLVRRMRQYAAVVSGLQPREAGGTTRPIGTAITPFRATAVDGTVIDERWLDAPTVVGFFSPGCPACKELLPDFVTAAASRRALAVVEDGNEPAEDYVTALAAVAPVLAGPEAQPAVIAFGVRGYPSVCSVDAHGVVSGVGVHLVQSRHAVAA